MSVNLGFDSDNIKISDREDSGRFSFIRFHEDYDGICEEHSENIEVSWQECSFIVQFSDIVFGIGGYKIKWIKYC